MSENLRLAAEAWASQPLVQTLGGSLMHFLWQGAVVAALLAVAFWALRGRSPNVRYLTACVAFASMSACPLGTFLWLSNASHTRGVDLVFITSTASDREMDLGPKSQLRIEAPLTRLDGDTSAEMLPQRSPSISSIVFDPMSILRTVSPWMVALWLVGVVALSSRLCMSWLTVHRLRQCGVHPVPAGWEDTLARIAERMRVSRPVKLLESALIEAPAVIGWLRPIVLVPASAWIGLSTSQLEALLAHELAHVRRHDYAVNFVQTALETLLFYHPAMWWVSSTIRLEREASCDEVAVEICGDRREYARALATMEELRGRERGLAVAANGGQLIYRIRRILGVPAPQANRSGWWLLAAVASTVVAMLAVDGPRGIQADSPDTGDRKQTMKEVGWGDESGGLRCRVTPIAVDADDESPDVTRSASYSRGEDLTLAVELKNVSDKPLTLLEGKGNTPFLGPHLFDLKFTDKMGKPIARAAREFVNEFFVLIESSTHEIEPDKTLLVVLRPTMFNAPMDYRLPPGEYQVQVRYHVRKNLVGQIAKNWPDKPHSKAWAGEAVSNTSPFTVAGNAQAPKAPELRWGGPTDGLRAAVEFLQGEKRLPTDGSQAVPLNTRLDVIFHIQNVADKSISFLSETWRQLDPVTVTNESGKKQMLRGPWYSGLPIKVRWTLKPKETAEIRAYGVGIAADQEAAGKFEHPIGPTVIANPGKPQFGYTIYLDDVETRDAEGNDVVPIEGPRRVELTTAETTVTIRPRTSDDDAAERAERFTGRVEFLTKEGKAVENGIFWLHTTGQREAPRLVDIYAGPIEVPDVTSRPVTVSVVAPGYEEVIFQGVELKPRELQRFALNPAHPTRFRLIAKGRPIAGAKVRHFNKTSDNASGGPYPMDGLKGPLRAVSAQDGTVVLNTLQKVNQGYESLGDAVYFLYIEAEGFAGRFLGPVKAGVDVGDVELSRPLIVRGEIHGTPEELKNFAAEWDQPFELKTANPDATWAYAVSQPLETKRAADILTFQLTGLRPGKLRIISNFSPGTHHVSHTWGRRDPQGTDVVVEVQITDSLDDLVITTTGRKPTESGR